MRLWPNGEVSIYKPKKQEWLPKSLRSDCEGSKTDDEAVASSDDSHLAEGASDMGLLNVSNFDKSQKPPVRYGLKGITSKGRRMVRNACYLLESEVQKSFLTFATVTLPPLHNKAMGLVHEKWAAVVDAYRREISRKLKRAGLSGEIIGVSEIQPERWKNTGYPVLHCHFVWVGRKRGHDWAVRPGEHDLIWKRAIATVLPGATIDTSKAAQLKPVRLTAEHYLSKYMSKGAAQLAEVVREGFDWWMPKQWWNCSRSLSKRVKTSTKLYRGGVGWLVDRGRDAAPDFWAFFQPINVELLCGDLATVGYVGKLTKHTNAMIREVLDNFTDIPIAKTVL